MDMGTTGVSALGLYESMAADFKWNPEWGEAHEVVAVNTRIEHFFAGAAIWGDLQSTPHSALVASLGWMTAQTDMGTEYKVDATPQRFYFAPHKPRAVQVMEPLVSEVDSSVVGVRTWVFVLDPKLFVREGFRKLITSNIEANEEREKMLERMRSSTSRRGGETHENAYLRAAGTVSGGLSTSPHRRIMSDLSLVNSVFSLYLGRQQSYGGGGDSVDALYSSGVLTPGSAFDPIDILGASTAFSLHLDGVRASQCNVDNYIDTSMGDTLSDFRGQFPNGVTAHRILSQYFVPELLCGTPLPHVMDSHIGPIYRKYTELGSQIARLREDIDDAEGVGDRSRVELIREDVASAEARRSYLIDAMDEKHEAIRREAPSASLGAGSMSDAFDASFVEEELVRRNAIRKMFGPCTERYAQIRRAFDDAEADARDGADVVEIEGMTFEETMQNVRGAMFDQFWRVFNTSSHVTPTLNALRRWFGSLRHKKGEAAHWTQHFGLSENLTPFGDMIVRMTNDYGDALEVETNFHLMHLTQFVVMAAARYKFGLRPNLIVTGEGGAGKSFAVDQAKEISIPGAIMNLTHLTKHGMNGGDDISDCCFIMEELPLDMIGVDKYGNTTAADPHLKARMTSGISTTMSQDRSTDEAAGERKSRLYMSRCMVSHIFISNDMLPPVNTAIMQRFIPYVMRRLKRSDADGQDRTFAMTTHDTFMRGARDEVFHGAKLQHAYLFIWEKAIEAGVMPDINMDTAHIVSRWIFDELAKRKVPVPSRRHKLMLLDLCRLITMYYAVDMEFLSEYAHAQRAHATGKLPAERRPPEPVGKRPHRQRAERRAEWDADRKAVDEYDAQVREAFKEGNCEEFQPWMLEGLVKWGVVTQEIVVFAISLLEFLWVPRTRTDISRAAASLARVSRDATGALAPSKTLTKFRREEAEGQVAPQFGQGQAAGGLQQQQQGNGVVVGNNSGAAAPTFDYRYIELVGHTTKEIAQKIRTQIPDPPSENDVMSAINAMANDYIVCRRKRFVERQRDTGIWDAAFQGNVLEDYFALEDDPGATAEVIPCAIIDTLSDKLATHTNRRRVCIAIDVIEQNFGAALKQSIQAALGHHYQPDQTFVTAFPHTTTDPDDPDGGPKTLYQVFDTIDIENKPGVYRYVLNTFGRTQNEIKALLTRRYGEVTTDQRKDIDTSEAPVYVVDKNLDHMSLQKYWTENGVAVEDVGPAYAPNAHSHMKYVRAEFPGALPSELRVDNYPENWVDQINERHREAKQWANINTDPDAAVLGDADTVPSYGKKTAKTTHQVSAEKRMLASHGDAEVLRKIVRDEAGDGEDAVACADSSSDGGARKRCAESELVYDEPPDMKATGAAFMRALNRRRRSMKHSRTS